MKRLLRYVIIITLLFAAFIFVLSIIPRYLTYPGMVDSDYIIIEGWLPKHGIEQAHQVLDSLKPKKVYICGTRYKDECLNTEDFIKSNKRRLVYFGKSKDTYRFIANAVFIYQFVQPLENLNGFNIEVTASGDYNDKITAHANVIINDSLICGFFTQTKDSVYACNYLESEIKTLIIHFNNDARLNDYDRNFNLKEIRINGTSLSVYNAHTYYTDKDFTKTYPTGIISYADDARVYLEDIGYSENNAYSIESEYVRYNKTLANAKAVKKQLLSESDSITSVNIITTGLHSTRSYVNYKNALKPIKVGIIPVLNHDEVHNEDGSFNFEKVRANIDESLSIIYTNLYWLLN